jgi:hypothetical protein
MNIDTAVVPNAGNGQAIAPQQDGQSLTLLGVIARAAADPTVDVAKMQALLEMQERLQERQAKAEFNSALARLTGRLPHVKKSGRIDLIDKNGVNKGSIPFAKWEDMDAVIRPLLEAEGMFLTFTSRPRTAEGGGLVVSGTLAHRDGHSITAEMPLPLDTGPGRNNLQATGSTLSYGKRYCAEMLLNIVREGDDTDGNFRDQEVIEPAKVKQISDLLSETKSNRDAFLRFMGVDKVEDIQVFDFPRAINALNAKKSRDGQRGRRTDNG